MGRKTKRMTSDPRSLYQTTSVVKKDVSAEADDVAAEVDAPPSPEERVPSPPAPSPPPATPSPTHEPKPVRPHQIPKLALDWQVYPAEFSEHVKLALTKRLLRCETVFGVVCGVHLEKVNIARGINASLGKRVYTWVFEAHHIVLGDMNAAWDVMSVRPSLERRDGSTPASTYGWVNPKTHQHATRESGTYLPGVEEVKVPRFPGDVVAINPSTFDNVVVHRPLAVYALPERRDRHVKGPRQLGAKFVPCKLPRALMASLPPNGWPSDHTSVMATVRSQGTSMTMCVATWNVADPHYFGTWWPSAALGFDKRTEPARLVRVQEHCVELLENTDVLALQEVPHSLVGALLRVGVRLGFFVEYVAAPSEQDPQYMSCVGRRYTTDGDTSADDDLPSCAHDMLFVRECMRA